MPFANPYIAIVDVGHGNCTVIREKDEVIVVDCGARSSGLLDFLKKEEITVINRLYISHADQDHIGGLVGIISSGEVSVKEIHFNSDGTKGSIWDDLTFALNELHEKGEGKVVPQISRSGDLIKCGNIALEVTGPSVYLVSQGVGGTDRSGKKITSNSISATFNIYWNNKSVAFLGGDLDQIALDDLIANKANLASPVLVFPHHGGRAGIGNLLAFSEALCDRVGPNTVVFSIGRGKHDNPREDVVLAIRRKIKDVRISCTQLSKACAENLTHMNFAHLVDVFSKGKESNFCCSGTFLIRLEKDTTHFPEITEHQNFIKSAAVTPLCHKTI
jgi:beta-lactamase superfamily II metal-dependent hydrolase